MRRKISLCVDINQSVIQISNLRLDTAVPDPGFAVGGTRVAPCSISCWQCLPGYVHSSDPEPISLLPDDSICLDIKQRMSPVGAQVAESDPKYSVQGRQQRALPFSLKRRDLHSQRRVLDGNRLMSVEEQADESKHEQQKHWHVSDSFHPSRCQSTRYARTEYWRTTGSPLP